MSTEPAPSRILVRCPNPVGDAVMATPALRALRRAQPQAEITLLRKDRARRLVAAGPDVEFGGFQKQVLVMTDLGGPDQLIGLDEILGGLVEVIGVEQELGGFEDLALFREQSRLLLGPLPDALRHESLCHPPARYAAGVQDHAGTGFEPSEDEH